MADEMGFETLFEVLMREKNREELQRLEAGFFDDALRFILKEEDLVHPSNHVGYQRVRNLRSLLRELYSRREQKIIRLATMAARGSSGQVDRAAMLAHEKELYTEISQILETTRKRRLEGRPARKTSPPAKTPVPEEPEADASTQDPQRLEVVFTTAVNKFMGEELEPYGPFAAGDSVALPASIARILLEKGQAKRA
jgi:DNA replication initiation complex subunit (GINS family)